MPKPSPLLTHLRIELAALALAGAGFWLVPEDPTLPALLLTAVALPLALLGWLVLSLVSLVPGTLGFSSSAWCQTP